VVEAMAAGVPVACGNTTSLPEVAGDAALFFDPRIPDAMARAMVALAGDEDLRARLIESGRRRAAAFADPDRMAASYWALFAEALGAQHAKATA
jgi:glycosyltransferase involved in cell wall biosynthesis